MNRNTLRAPEVVRTPAGILYVEGDAIPNSLDARFMDDAVSRFGSVVKAGESMTGSEWLRAIGHQFSKANSPHDFSCLTAIARVMLVDQFPTARALSKGERLQQISEELSALGGYFGPT